MARVHRIWRRSIYPQGAGSWLPIRFAMRNRYLREVVGWRMTVSDIKYLAVDHRLVLAGCTDRSDQEDVAI
jgi:hypothetical protein